ncbi:DUF4329 domain-containing protein [Pseudoruegeria sp. SHC-113]|uniref:DUF4329 domain-containing protein n=1 Tax=Pseudoruegeria sp. SHC-113 TaxID=2855439 RepID=UPI0021BB7408|nr:DUF4329 domain-containing protein [Pseudoruegeria sp. SHC-113]MCT8159853.1 DUF4329 domain-containing protein [Pseudoruegeria sp. SHC-113]
MAGLRAALLLLFLLPVGALAQSAEEMRFAKAFLNALQERSFARNREYCGYFGYTPEGRLAATQPRRGQADSCLMRWSTQIEVFASYHTHGAFDPGHFNEFPSSTDIESDRAEGINGYVATPGGRLWFVDGARGTARQLCGLGCLKQDPGFVAGLDGVIPDRLSLRQIRRWEDGR